MLDKSPLEGVTRFTPRNLREYAAYQMKRVDRAYRFQSRNRFSDDQKTNWYDQGLDAYREAKKAEFAARYMERTGLGSVRQIGRFGLVDIKDGQCVRIISGAPIWSHGWGRTPEENERKRVHGCHRFAQRTYLVQVTTSILHLTTSEICDYDYDSVIDKMWSIVHADMFQRIGWRSGHETLYTYVNNIEIL